MNPHQRIDELEVEVQLLTTSRDMWKQAAHDLHLALGFTRPGCAQKLAHQNAKAFYNKCLNEHNQTPLPGKLSHRQE